MEKVGKVSKGDKKDVDHIKPLSRGGETKTSNLRILTQKDNRSFHRGGHKWVGPADSLAAEHLTGKEAKHG
jgi:5-methylcytosine-specific restriction endonuclease McrA